MARKPRIHFAGAFYHVIARGNQKQSIFLDSVDFQTYLSYLAEYKSRFSFHLYAYALMKNHVHLLWETEEVPLSKIMQILQFRYTRYFNRKYRKVGHLFQGRYRAILCDKESYLLELVRYIHLNPVRGGVVERPEKYPWTGHLSYLGRDEKGLVDVGMVLSQFGRSKSLARRRYRDFVREGLKERHQEKYYRVKDQRYLGEDEFVEKIEGRKKSSEGEYREIPLEVICREVMDKIGIPEDRLYSLSRDRLGAYGRGLVAYLAREVAGVKVKEIGRYFKRESMTISFGVRKIESLLQRERGLAQTMEAMELALQKKGKKKYFITIA